MGDDSRGQHLSDAGQCDKIGFACGVQVQKIAAVFNRRALDRGNGLKAARGNKL